MKVGSTQSFFSKSFSDLTRIARVTLLLVIFFTACAPSSPSSINYFQTAITDGTQYSGHPHVGYFLVNGNQLCTGTLIGKHTVLTAAHCLDEATSLEANFNNIKRTVKNSVQHPSWDKNTLVNDIALLVLDQDITDIAPGAISSNPVSVGLAITLIGYGATAENAQDSLVKRKATNTIKDVYTMRFTIAGTGNGTGNTCYGDSGGPAFSTFSGKEVQVGVTSAGADKCGTLGYDTRVDAYRDWIISTAAGDVSGGTPPTDDKTKPTVSITSPTAGWNVSLSFNLMAEVTDNVGVSEVEFFVDGASQGKLTSSPFTKLLTVSAGAHALKVTGRDAAGNVGQAQINVTASANGTDPSGPAPGTFGATCKTNADCNSNLCAYDTQTQKYYCTELCDPNANACLQGAACLPVGEQWVCGPPNTAQSGVTSTILVGSCQMSNAPSGSQISWLLTSILMFLGAGRRFFRR